MKRLAILGSTGSIGRNTLSIVERFPDRFTVGALTAWENIDLLAVQVERFQPEIAVVRDARTAGILAGRIQGKAKTDVLYGPDGYRIAATLQGVDQVVAAMVGSAGVVPTVAAIKAGKEIALANKETLVTAGSIVMELAASSNIRILPVDSEHSAIFQCLQGNRSQDLDRILLTASGGPFRTRPAETFGTITPADAMAHPNWQMGAKITVDSATLMNKGLEIIEAHHIFNVRMDQIQVLVHPQSIIHSMVAFRDGSVMAQMGIPDMKGAIAYALSYPERLALGQPVPDFSGKASPLTFEEPDLKRFPCLAIAMEAGVAGKTWPAVMNAANEVAVQAFLERRIGFLAIPDVIRRVMDRHQAVSQPDLSVILDADAEARRMATEII